MKMLKLFSLAAVIAVVPLAYAQKGNWVFPRPANTNPPPADYVVDPPPPPLSTLRNPAPAPYVYEQKPLPGRPLLISPEQAQTIIARFKAAYPALGNPRFLIYVNRELVDDKSGLKLTERTERVEGETGSGDTNGLRVEKSVVRNTYAATNPPATPLADRQTARDIERLFGRPLREAGATLVDQKVAAELIAGRPLEDFIGSADTPEMRQQREALLKNADAVIEVLIASKDMTVATLTGSQTISVPDIQATAINLKDSRIIGQAASSEVTSRVPAATLGNFDVREVTEATALALMEDMTPDQ
jgi:hypothetical protein